MIGLDASSFVDVTPTASAVFVPRGPGRAPTNPGRVPVPGRVPGRGPTAPGRLPPGRLPPSFRSSPRDKITGPLSLVATPTDETLFEDAANPQLKFYLPRYRLAEQAVSGTQQFRVRLEPGEQGGSLTIFLEKFPAPALAGFRDAAEIPHAIALKLNASIPVGTSQIQQEFVFQEITLDGGLVKAVLRLENLAALTQVFQILTEAPLAASLSVLRSFRVAVLVPIDTSATVRQLTLQVQTLTQEIIALDRQINTLTSQRSQLQKLIVAQPRLRPQLQQRLKIVQSQLASAGASRTQKVIARQAAQTRLSTLTQQKFYRASSQLLAWMVSPQPFVFPRDLHPYIFGNLGPTDGGQLRLAVHQLPWKERSHSYYQQAANPLRFYFLPDAFKVTRQDESPRAPRIGIRFPSPDSPPETMPVTLEYVAAPVVDEDRLEDAAGELKRKLPQLADETRPIEFEPLLCDTTKLFMTLPRGDAGPQLQERPGVTVDLRTGIRDAVTLPMTDFQAVFDALFGASAVLFQGEALVELDCDGAIPSERVPVTCRLDDLAGDLLDMDGTPDAATGGVKATLRNGIESPVVVKGLKAVLVRGDSIIDATVRGPSFDTPIVLVADASLECEVVPSAPADGAGEVTAVFDSAQVAARPDAQAVWDAVVDKTRLPEATRPMKVKTIRQTFDPPAGNAPDPIVALVVDFERGDSVELNADALEADTKVRLPLEDFVIRKLGTGEYRDKVTVIRVSGQARDADWRVDTTGILFPTVAPAPPPQ